MTTTKPSPFSSSSSSSSKEQRIDDYDDYFSKYKHITPKQIQSFTQDGYLLIKSIIPQHECQQYDITYIQPALKKFANLDEGNPSTWFCKNNLTLEDFVVHDQPSFIRCKDGEEDKKGIPIGLMIKDSCNIYDDLNPIPTDAGGNWSAFFDNERLIGILNELHCVIPNLSQQQQKQQKQQQKQQQQQQHAQQRWEFLHPNNVGWIHVRLPLSHDDQFFNKYAQNNHQRHPHEEEDKFHIPYNEQTWHVDGGHFTPHHLSSLDQSVILLPMIRDVPCHGGGNTIVLARSHVHIAHKLQLHDSRGAGIDKNELNSYCEELSKSWPKEFIVEVAPCHAGDVLILHPFLVHSAGWNTREVRIMKKSNYDDDYFLGNDVRIKESTRHDGISSESSKKNNEVQKMKDSFRLTFNIGTKWRKSSLFEGMDHDRGDDGGNKRLLYDTDNVDQCSIIEWSVCKSLHDIMKV